MEGFGQAAGVPPPAQETARPAAGEAQMTGGEPASPEEQEAYDKFVSMALLHMHDEKVAPKLAERMRSGDPVETIGRVGAALGMTLIEKAREAGEEIPGDVILHGGREIIDALVEMAEASGVGPLSEEDAEQAFYVAADEFRDMMQAGGQYDQETAQADAQEIMGNDEVGQRLSGYRQRRGMA